MAKILAIDSSSSLCAVGLLLGEHTKSLQSPSQRAAAQSLLPLVDQLLKDSNTSLTDLDAIAVSAGPGSFTGIRIGIGIAQGLAEAAQIRVIPVSSMAHTAWDVGLQADCRFVRVAMHARDDEFYFANFMVEPGNGAFLLGKEYVGTLDSLERGSLLGPPEHAAADWIATGSGWEQVPGLLNALGNPELTRPDSKPSVDSLCSLAAQRLIVGECGEGELPLPNYVKENMDYS